MSVRFYLEANFLDLNCYNEPIKSLQEDRGSWIFSWKIHLNFPGIYLPMKGNVFGSVPIQYAHTCPENYEFDTHLSHSWQFVLSHNTPMPMRTLASKVSHFSWATLKTIVSTVLSIIFNYFYRSSFTAPRLGLNINGIGNITIDKIDRKS